MKKATDVAVDAIAKMSSKVNGKEHIARVAAISAGDEEGASPSTSSAMIRSFAPDCTICSRIGRIS